MIVASGIYYGFLTHDQKKFTLLGEQINECANEFVFVGSSYEFRVLLSCIYAYLEHGILPTAGGYLDQPPIYIDALTTFTQAKTFWESERDKIKKILKELGA